MIVGHLSLGASGLELHRTGAAVSSARRRDRRGDRREIVLGKELYLCADSAGIWPGPEIAPLVARVNRRRYLTSPAVLAAASRLVGDSAAPNLIPAECVPDEDDSRTSVRPAKRIRRRCRFRPIPDRSQLAARIILGIVCFATIIGLVMSYRIRRSAELEQSRSAMAIVAAETQSVRADAMKQDLEELKKAISQLDGNAVVPVASLTAALLASLPAEVTVERIALDAAGVVMDTNGGDPLASAAAVESLPMVGGVTVRMRIEANGLVTGQIRGRLGE